jgi:predicted transcriptional regulator
MKKLVADMSAITSDVELKKAKQPRTKKLLVKPYVWADEEIDSLIVFYEQSLTIAEISAKMRIPAEDVKTQITKLKNDGNRLLRKEFKKQEIKPIGDDVFDLKD